MKTEREIRGEIIAQLTNVYANTADVGPGAEPQPLWDMPGAWTREEFMEAYAELAAMFLYYARVIESEHGPGFLDYLQRQALINAAGNGDDPAAPA